MTPDWKALAPHKPLEAGSEAYVAPPTGGAEAIANWVLAGGETVLVGGPTGVGKSTELAGASALLAQSRLSCLLPVDRYENMRALTADRLRLLVAGRLVSVAKDSYGMRVSEPLAAALSGVTGDLLPGPLQASPRSLLANALAEVGRLAGERRIALLIDGLEKVAADRSQEVFSALAEIPTTIDLVAVIPWHAAFGPIAEVVIREGERLVNMRAAEVERPEGRQFLLDILQRREGGTLPAEVAPLAVEAAVLSGGLPRTFLQLLADAGTYARLKRGADWPGPSDLADAAADRADSFRRLLLPGDAAAIAEIAGTDGRELELSRKLRLMAHGILLERVRNGLLVLDIHPLAQRVLFHGHA